MVSVTTVVSEKWMERFVLDLDVSCSDVLASGEAPAGCRQDPTDLSEKLLPEEVRMSAVSHRLV